MPPVLEGRVLTTGSPGKSQFAFLFLRIFVSMFMGNFGLEFSWLIVFLTGIGIKVLLGSRNEAGIVSPYFLKLFEEYCYRNFKQLNCLGFCSLICTVKLVLST